MNDLPVILQDTREPNEEHDHPSALFCPWVWRGKQKVGLPIRRVKLDEGDYTVEGLERHVIVERKTMSDLLGTLFGREQDASGDVIERRERFYDELNRMRSYHLRRIVVEGDEDDLEHLRLQQDRFGGQPRQFNPMAARALLDRIEVTFGVPIAWRHNREMAERYVGNLCRFAWEESRGGEAAEKARKRGSTAPWLPVVAP